MLAQYCIGVATLNLRTMFRDTLRGVWHKLEGKSVQMFLLHRERKGLALLPNILANRRGFSLSARISCYRQQGRLFVCPRCQDWAYGDRILRVLGWSIVPGL